MVGLCAWPGWPGWSDMSHVIHIKLHMCPQKKEFNFRHSLPPQRTLRHYPTFNPTGTHCYNDFTPRKMPLRSHFRLLWSIKW